MVTHRHDIRAYGLTWTFTEGHSNGLWVVCDLTIKRTSPAV